MVHNLADVYDQTHLYLDTRSPSARGERELPPLPIPLPAHEYPKYPTFDPVSKEHIPIFDPVSKEPILSAHLPDRPEPVPWMKQRTWGRRRWHLLALTCLLLVIVILAIALPIGIRNAKTSNASSSLSTPVADPNVVNTVGLQTFDVRVDSLLAAYGSILNAENAALGSPNTQLYYQSAFGNIKEVNQSIAIQNTTVAYPVVFDAINGTGVAVFPYQNGSQLQSSLIYVDSQSTLAEARSSPGTPTATRWQPGPLRGLGLSVSGGQTFGSGSSFESPKNGWDSMRMAAAYSAAFSSGAGARLFYHGSNADSNFIQEVIWNQANDSWSLGASLTGCVAQSHFSAVIDQSSQVLRLFYTAPGNTLAEYQLNISQPNARYLPGVTIPNLLINPSADFAAVSTSKGVFLYYASALSPISNVTIRELALPAPLLNFKSPNPSDSTLVITPNLLAPNPTNSSLLTSLYAPLTAAYSSSGTVEQITLFWADNPIDPQGGYKSLNSLSRNLVESWPGAAGTANSGPERTQSLPIGNLDCDLEARCFPL